MPITVIGPIVILLIALLQPNTVPTYNATLDGHGMNNLAHFDFGSATVIEGVAVTHPRKDPIDPGHRCLLAVYVDHLVRIKPGVVYVYQDGGTPIERRSDVVISTDGQPSTMTTVLRDTDVIRAKDELIVQICGFRLQFLGDELSAMKKTVLRRRE